MSAPHTTPHTTPPPTHTVTTVVHPHTPSYAHRPVAEVEEYLRESASANLTPVRQVLAMALTTQTHMSETLAVAAVRCLSRWSSALCLPFRHLTQSPTDGNSVNYMLSMVCTAVETITASALLDACNELIDKCTSAGKEVGEPWGALIPPLAVSASRALDACMGRVEAVCQAGTEAENVDDNLQRSVQSLCCISSCIALADKYVSTHIHTHVWRASCVQSHTLVVKYEVRRVCAGACVGHGCDKGAPRPLVCSVPS